MNRILALAGFTALLTAPWLGFFVSTALGIILLLNGIVLLAASGALNLSASSKETSPQTYKPHHTVGFIAENTPQSPQSTFPESRSASEFKKAYAATAPQETDRIPTYVFGETTAGCPANTNRIRVTETVTASHLTTPTASDRIKP